MEHDGIQEVDNEIEQDCTHEHRMTQEETLKACKPQGELKPAACCDGTLGKTSQRKLTNKLRQMSEALTFIDDAIKPAETSQVIAPAMLARLIGLRDELAEHRDAMTSYMQANKEEDTDKIVAVAKTKMDTAQHQCRVITRMLKMGEKTFPDKKEIETTDCLA